MNTPTQMTRTVKRSNNLYSTNKNLGHGGIAILGALESVSGPDGAGNYKSRCPFHPDDNPSFSIHPQHGFICYACGEKGSTKKLYAHFGLSLDTVTLSEPSECSGHKAKNNEVVTHYDYRDESGTLLYQTYRTDFINDSGQPDKTIKQRCPNGSGGWNWYLKNVRRVIYRLPEVLEAEIVYVVEGEKCADALNTALQEAGRFGREAATTNPQGAGKWRDDYSVVVREKNVIVLPDNDDPGKRHAAQVAASICKSGGHVKVLNLPNLNPKGDVCDWLKAGGTVETLDKLAEAEPFWEPDKNSNSDTPSDVSALSRSVSKAIGWPVDREHGDDVPIIPGHRLTDTGNAERFVSQHGHKILYASGLGWMIWNNTHWEEDANNKVFELGKKTVRNIYHEASKATDDERPRLAAWAKTSESMPRREAMIKIASKDSANIKANLKDFDKNPMLFNVANGTLDLETGSLRPHYRQDRISKMAPVIFDPSAKAPHFLGFVETLFGGDTATRSETIEFLQRFMGYTLTGLTREQCFLILHGDGSNGKSTFLNVFRWLLGPYCMQTKPDTLMKKHFGDGISNDVAMLRGARMVTAIETNEGRQFDEAKIKEMTGGDPVTARFLHKEFFEYNPEFKLYLATNYKPQIIGNDLGMWRRIRLLPFDMHFWNPDRKGETGPAHLRADKTLGDKLRNELPGILNWTLQGCLEWQREGLPEPKRVADATAEYRVESDPIEAFLNEMCTRLPHCQTLNKHLYEAFKEWALGEGKPELSNKAFSARLKLRGFQNPRAPGGYRMWQGIGLLGNNQSEGVSNLM